MQIIMGGQVPALQTNGAMLPQGGSRVDVVVVPTPVVVVVSRVISVVVGRVITVVVVGSGMIVVVVDVVVVVPTVPVVVVASEVKCDVPGSDTAPGPGSSPLGSTIGSYDGGMQKELTSVAVCG